MSNSRDMAEQLRDPELGTPWFPDTLDGMPDGGATPGAVIRYELGGLRAVGATTVQGDVMVLDAAVSPSAPTR